MERYRTSRQFSVAFQIIFAINFNSFSMFFLSLLGLSSIQFLFPVSPLGLFRICEPLASGMHCTCSDHTFMLATLQHLQKNGGQREGCRCQRPCQEKGGSVAEAATLGTEASGLPRRGAPVPCSYLKSPQNGSP